MPSIAFPAAPSPASQGVLQNIGGIETDGIDINFDLTTVETGIGGFHFQWLTSLLLSYDELFANPAGGFDRVDRKGFELGSPARGFVETKSTLNADWILSDWSARLSLRYLSSLTEQCVGNCGGFATGALFERSCQTNELDSVIYTDFRSAGRPRSSSMVTGHLPSASTTFSTRSRRSASPAT